VGRQREHNEDALFTLTTEMVSDSQHQPFGLYIVADGMGGHLYGERASGIAVRAMVNEVISRLYAPLFNLTSSENQPSTADVLQAGIQAAHRSVLELTPGGGTTLTGALIYGEQMTIAHVGDSRAYVIPPEGKLQVLTRDHSLVKRLVELGQISTEEAAVHPQRNVLYRALGQGEPIDAEIITAPMPKSGFLMLCSDGLWGTIPEDTLVETVQSATSVQEACQRLVEAANASGGPDNITVILIKLPD
jgi:serine/threonine protein phosphatase PrpC